MLKLKLKHFHRTSLISNRGCCQWYFCWWFSFTFEFFFCFCLTVIIPHFCLRVFFVWHFLCVLNFVFKKCIQVIYGWERHQLPGWLASRLIIVALELSFLFYGEAVQSTNRPNDRTNWQEQKQLEFKEEVGSSSRAPRRVSSIH